MPIIKSAKKALRSSARKRVYNVRRQAALKDAVKAFDKAVSGGKRADAEALVRDAYQAIDKAAKRGIIKANTAARKKSRLMASLKKMA
jgi:small subunit ribosomal protein S20